MKISINELREKLLGTLQENFSKEQSNQVADVLLWCDMSGINIMGTMKLTGSEPLQNITPKYDMKIDRETKLSALIDAGANPAPLAAQIATDMVIKSSATFK